MLDTEGVEVIVRLSFWSNGERGKLDSSVHSNPRSLEDSPLQLGNNKNHEGEEPEWEKIRKSQKKKGIRPGLQKCRYDA